MEKYLLDTNICIFLLRGKYDVDKKIDRLFCYCAWNDNGYRKYQGF